MNEDIIKLLANRYYHVEDISEWAVKCLEKGYDSKSLRILTSMPESLYSSSETDQYFQRSLKELSWDDLKPKDYLKLYAKILAREILENKLNPIKAARDIYGIIQDLEYPSELCFWSEVDLMVWDYEYFLETGEKDHWFHPKEELINEIKKASKKLIEKLKN